MKRRKVIAYLIALMAVAAVAITIIVLPRKLNEMRPEVDYSDVDNWMYYETVDTGKDADVFFVCPTSTVDGEYADIEDREDRAAILAATNMEIGIYDDNARAFAPYYRMVTLECYGDDVRPRTREERLSNAYKDVSAAFGYYLENENEGRPIILAGFSQGADMIYRLIEEYYAPENEDMPDLIAAYAIGWECTQDMVDEHPQLKMAEGETDTGVIISFECESENVDDSIIVPAGTKMLSINPLNWTTESTPADKSENLGYVHINGATGEIIDEIPKLCGGYIDPERGTLKVTDISEEDYPAVLSFLPDGSYHIYDYEFFYRNLEANVKKRIKAAVGR